jgi:hypothetical protein
MKKSKPLQFKPETLRLLVEGHLALVVGAQPRTEDLTGFTQCRDSICGPCSAGTYC